MSFVMKIINFVKSVKTSFVASLTPKCTRVLRTTPWQAKPKQHNSTHRIPQNWSPTGNAELLFRRVAEPQGRAGVENLVLMLMRRDFHSHRITSFHLILRHRSTATGKRKLSFLPLCKMFQNCHFSWFCYYALFEAIPIRIFVILISWIHLNY